MKHMIIAFTALLTTQAAWATCTPDEVNQKAEELAERVSQLTQSNPELAEQINEQLKQMDVERGADELGDECQAYEQRLEHIEQAERQMPASQ